MNSCTTEGDLHTAPSCLSSNMCLLHAAAIRYNTRAAQRAWVMLHSVSNLHCCRACAWLWRQARQVSARRGGASPASVLPPWCCRAHQDFQERVHCEEMFKAATMLYDSYSMRAFDTTCHVAPCSALCSSSR